jgi:hypothetical protein
MTFYFKVQFDHFFLIEEYEDKDEYKIKDDVNSFFDYGIFNPKNAVITNQLNYHKPITRYKYNSSIKKSKQQEIIDYWNYKYPNNIYDDRFEKALAQHDYVLPNKQLSEIGVKSNYQAYVPLKNELSRIANDIKLELDVGSSKYGVDMRKGMYSWCVYEYQAIDRVQYSNYMRLVVIAPNITEELEYLAQLKAFF